MSNFTDSALRIGIDVGGTFTDFVAYDPQLERLFENKVLTTLSQPTQAILTGLKTLLEDANISTEQLSDAVIIHGTTLITNALITRSGKSPALITTKGAGDILETGKGNRYDPYDRMLERPAPLVPRRLRKMVDERSLADGSVYKVLDEEQVKRVFRGLVEEGVEAVAVCLLHSYANAAHEERIRAIAEEMGLKLYLSLSSSLSPELGEYERMTTTAANAYIQPIAVGYLAELREALQELGHAGRFYLMWSDGGLASVEATLEMPIRLLESGPAAGALAVRHLAKDLGLERVQSFISSVEDLDLGALSAVMEDLRSKAVTTLASGGVAEGDSDFAFALDMRYRGQGYDVQVPVEPDKLNREDLQATFRTTYSQRYGQGQAGVVEVRACRLSAHGPEPEVMTSGQTTKASSGDTKTRRVWFADVGDWLETRVVNLAALEPKPCKKKRVSSGRSSLSRASFQRAVSMSKRKSPLTSSLFTFMQKTTDLSPLPDCRTTGKKATTKSASTPLSRPNPTT